MSVTAKEIDEIVEKEKASFLKDYKRIVESPSISALSEHKKDIQETAKIAAGFLRQAGAEVKVYETKGNPVVFARMENNPNAPTVAIYNHLDVQPATKGKDGWTRDPFTFEEENGRFYSRGTTDDKGPAMTALWASKIARQKKIPLNVEFIWELEEEIGSPNFSEFLEKAKSQFKADSILVSDTIWLARGKPVISMGLRGLLGVFLTIETGKKEVHSGLTGGAARNPIAELCQIISQCFNAKTGEITIPGFDKTWTAPTQEQKEEYIHSGFSLENFKTAHELFKLRTEDPGELASRIFASPTFEVHGIVGGYQGEGLKTIVPPKAEAKISLRLTPGQDPSHIFELLVKYIKKINPDCEVKKEKVLEPYAAPKDNPLVEKVEEALNFGFGATPAFISEGGSIGAVLTMDQILKKPILFMGLSLPEDGYHGPDESFAWEQIQGGVKAFVHYFELLSSR